MIADTATRVTDQTPPGVNEQIRHQIELNIAYFTEHPEQIHQRLMGLNREWGVERVLESGSAGLSLLGLALGVLVRRRWLLAPVLIQAFMAHHALRGWCPPLPVLRRMGVRTSDEINSERYALKAIRGDFDAVASGTELRAASNQVLRAVDDR